MTLPTDPPAPPPAQTPPAAPAAPETAPAAPETAPAAPETAAAPAASSERDEPAGSAQPVNPLDTVGLADTLTGGLRPVRRAALGLGSNVGDRFDTLQGAVDSLCETPEIAGVAVSAVYETDPVGGPADQDTYLNAVLVVDTSLAARELLERAMAVEQAFGRVRDQPWGPRTLDVDVLALARSTVTEPDLQVPHPRLAQRAFVLVPWRDADPSFDVAGLGRVDDLASKVEDTGVRRRADLVLLLPAR